MHKFVRQLITEWRYLGLPTKRAAVIVAVSGGADSTGMLLALADLRDRKKLTLDLIVSHFNHQLRGKDSDADERFVRKLAADAGIEFVMGKGSLKGRSNLEHRAREERYAFLANVAKNKEAAFVITGHTLNDQAETFLLNLIRGSGIDGLRAMPPAREISADADVKLVRPLVRWARREDTERFCRDLGIKYREDKMNFDPRFSRVRIRTKILPELEEINPKIVETLGRTAELLGTLSGCRNPETAPDLGLTLKISDLKTLENAEIYDLIRTWLRESRGSLRGITMKHIEAIARLANSSKSGRIVELPGGEAVKGGGRLAFRHIKLEY